MKKEKNQEERKHDSLYISQTKSVDNQLNESLKKYIYSNF
jgi:hypothetical protein